MSVSDGFRDLVVEQLGALTPGVRAKPMFGGISIANNAGTFALIDDDILYLKGDKLNRSAFEAADWPPFRPFGPEGSAMGYFAVPGELLDDLPALAPWLRLAQDAAQRAQHSRRRA